MTETTREQRLETALLRSVIAIDDWLNLDASDLCDKTRVKEARSRIGVAGGTLAYIADVQARNREAMNSESPRTPNMPDDPGQENLLLRCRNDPRWASEEIERLRREADASRKDPR